MKFVDSNFLKVEIYHITLNCLFVYTYLKKTTNFHIIHIVTSLFYLMFNTPPMLHHTVKQIYI